MRAGAALVLGAMASTLLTACLSDEATVQQTSPGRTPTIATTHTPSSDGGLVFPVQQEATGMESQTHGRLVKRGRCLVVIASPQSEPDLPIWPPGFSYERRGGSVVVLEVAKSSRV